MICTRILTTLLLIVSFPILVSGQLKPSAGMMRSADVSSESIVFVYADDLWVVDRSGGMARPLASPAGEEQQPRFSPDGEQIAFVGNYDGGRDIYTINVNGGAAERLTYHPSREKLCDWTPDGQSVIYSSGGFSALGLDELFTISADEPMPKKMPVHEGAMGTIHKDGEWLAFIPQNSRDHRTWKRYRGGMATDIWLFHLKDHTSKQVTDFEGTDSQPMWHNDQIYYVSDAGPKHRINIWCYDTNSGERRQVTKFKDFDCKWPAIGPGPKGDGEIVLQNGSQLFLLDLKTEEATSVSITIPGDRPNIRKQRHDASENTEWIEISSTGKRVVVSARGDVWSLPVKNGAPRNLTDSGSSHERFASWSPDGESIAYFSDATGEYELYVMQSDGRGETVQLTKDNKAFLARTWWSPDSTRIVFSDNTGALRVHTIATNETKQIDSSPNNHDYEISWSHDSKWVTYAKAAKSDPDTRTTALDAIWVANVDDGSLHQLTDNRCNDMAPVFDRVGDFIYFYSNRGINNPKYSDSGDSWIYSATEVMIALPLRKDVKNPLTPKSDEEEFGDDDTDKDDEEKDSEDKADEEKDGEDKDGEDKDSEDAEDKENGNDNKAKGEDEGDEGKDEGDKGEGEDDEEDEDKEVKPLKIDFEGIERRAFALPIDQGFFGKLVVNSDNKLIYSCVPTSGGDEPRSIKVIDLFADEIEEKTIVKDVSNYEITADGKKLLIVKFEGKLQLFVIDAAADQKLEKPVSTSGMSVVVDPRDEWKQILVEAWRLERQFFYDPNMHGVDWGAVLEHYEPMLKDCVSRRDLSFIIREMISELNVGHSYYRETDLDNGEGAKVGLLGLRFEIENDAYRVADIIEGSASDVDARNPFRTAGGKVGDYLLAINDRELKTDTNPYAAFDGLAGQTVALTVSDDAELDDADRRLLLKPVRSTGDLRYRHFVASSRKRVEELSKGKVGYIHVPNTGRNGQSELVRQFHEQRHLPALIIDERWNSGGQIPTRFIELLNRPAVGYFSLRTGATDVYPESSHQGPKCMLINGMAGSGGDMFPYLFRQAGLGKLIGTRTWGGLVGISSIPRLIDGAEVTAPGFAFYELDGTWGVEGHGVDPDLKVVADPAKTFDGGDPQLEAGVEQMLKELEQKTFRIPAIPAYPDRSKMGIKPEDK